MFEGTYLISRSFSNYSGGYTTRDGRMIILWHGQQEHIFTLLYTFWASSHVLFHCRRTRRPEREAEIHPQPRLGAETSFKRKEEARKGKNG